MIDLSQCIIAATLSLEEASSSIASYAIKPLTSVTIQLLIYTSKLIPVNNLEPTLCTFCLTISMNSVHGDQGLRESGARGRIPMKVHAGVART